MKNFFKIIFLMIAVTASVVAQADYKFSAITNAATGATATSILTPDGSPVITSIILTNSVQQIIQENPPADYETVSNAAMNAVTQELAGTIATNVVNDKVTLIPVKFSEWELYGVPDTFSNVSLEWGITELGYDAWILSIDFDDFDGTTFTYDREVSQDSTELHFSFEIDKRYNITAKRQIVGYELATDRGKEVAAPAITNWLVTASITNGLASVEYVDSATNGLVGATITNGLVTASITNGLVASAALASVATSGAYSDLTGTPTKLSDFTNDDGFVTESITNGLVTATITNDLVTASVTNGIFEATQNAISEALATAKNYTDEAIAAGGGGNGINLKTTTGTYLANIAYAPLYDGMTNNSLLVSNCWLTNIVLDITSGYPQSLTAHLNGIICGRNFDNEEIALTNTSVSGITATATIEDESVTYTLSYITFLPTSISDMPYRGSFKVARTNPYEQAQWYSHTECREFTNILSEVDSQPVWNHDRSLVTSKGIYDVVTNKLDKTGGNVLGNISFARGQYEADGWKIPQYSLYGPNLIATGTIYTNASIGVTYQAALSVANRGNAIGSTVKYPASMYISRIKNSGSASENEILHYTIDGIEQELVLVSSGAINDHKLQFPRDNGGALLDGTVARVEDFDFTNDFALASSLASVATSGAYSDLTGTPTKLSDFTNDDGFVTETITNGLAITSITNGLVASASLASVATSGAYTDLVGAPSKLSDFTNDEGFVDKNITNGLVSANVVTNIVQETVPSWARSDTKPSYSWDDISGKPPFKAVATSGLYSDLSGRPTTLAAFENTPGYVTKSVTNGLLASSSLTQEMLQSLGMATQTSIDTTRQGLADLGLILTNNIISITNQIASVSNQVVNKKVDRVYDNLIDNRIAHYKFDQIPTSDGAHSSDEYLTFEFDIIWTNYVVVVSSGKRLYRYNPVNMVQTSGASTSASNTRYVWNETDGLGYWELHAAYPASLESKTTPSQYLTPMAAFTTNINWTKTVEDTANYLSRTITLLSKADDFYKQYIKGDLVVYNKDNEKIATLVTTSTNGVIDLQSWEALVVTNTTLPDYIRTMVDQRSMKMASASKTVSGSVATFTLVDKAYNYAVSATESSLTFQLPESAGELSRKFYFVYNDNSTVGHTVTLPQLPNSGKYWVDSSEADYLKSATGVNVYSFDEIFGDNFKVTHIVLQALE